MSWSGVNFYAISDLCGVNRFTGRGFPPIRSILCGEELKFFKESDLFAEASAKQTTLARGSQSLSNCAAPVLDPSCKALG